MKPGDIPLIGDRAEKLLFALIRIGEHRQRLVAMRRDDDMIVSRGGAGDVDDGDARFVAPYRGGACAEPQPGRERGR